MAKVKTITVRLPQSTYERLCEFADSLEELPSETARNILREFIANLGAGNLAQKQSETETELSPALKRVLARPTELDKITYRILSGKPKEIVDKMSQAEIDQGFARLDREKEGN